MDHGGGWLCKKGTCRRTRPRESMRSRSGCDLFWSRICEMPLSVVLAKASH